MNKAAQALGRLAKGKSKSYSPAERRRRAMRMREINERRRNEVITIATTANEIGRRTARRAKRAILNHYRKIGRKGGLARTPAKVRSARRNGRMHKGTTK